MGNKQFPDNNSNCSGTTEFNHRKVLERHIQRLERPLEKELQFEDLERLSLLLVKAIEAYDRLQH